MPQAIQYHLEMYPGTTSELAQLHSLRQHLDAEAGGSQVPSQAALQGEALSPSNKPESTSQ